MHLLSVYTEGRPKTRRNYRERVAAVLNGQKPDRLPMVEWAAWWDLTTSRWQKEGAPAQTGPDTLQNWFGLDPLRQIWLGIRSGDIPQPVSHGAGILTDEDDYNRLHHCLFTEEPLEDA